ncbi:phosphohistidine phosphatase [Mariniflexile fucanivorans]|uniref:Phosphohistidine phosphatase n=1 Tax=Mariniflexile fucanivorans TaxID=264023 RepID=A0A4R1RGE4_9FLAO|nr:histidine phosphatase family protein [Mariniflexile fucanivorans]TCL65053.1 phosphohistidine phosphatase [Mariniflexile fucanivorans]
MKKLLLVRHAKSSWEHNVIDHERPLNDRGVSDAQTVSNRLKNDHLKIDLILCSDSVRTTSTAKTFISNLDLDKNILVFNHDLYDFSGSNLIQVIKACNNKVNNLMVFGHNHAITAFVNTFGDSHIENVPTCGVVQIEFNINSWEDLNKGKTVSTLFPRDLR